MADLVVSNGIAFKRRNPWGAFGLIFLTLGVYYFVWWYKINNELKAYGVENNPTVAVLAVLLGPAIVVPPYVSYYKTADRILQAQVRAGAPERMTPILGLLLFVVASVFAVPYYQSQLNKAWDALATAGAEVRPA